MKKTPTLFSRLWLAFLAVAVTSAGLTGYLIGQSVYNLFGSFLGMSGMMGQGPKDPMSGMTQAMQEAAWSFLANVAWTAVVGMLIGSGLALLLGTWLARTVVGPVEEMRRAASRLARGDYQARVPPADTAELQALAADMNALGEALDRAEHVRTTMTADIAHELRNPLTAIQGMLEGMRDGVVPTNKANLEVAVAEARRLGRLVDELRLLSLADEGRLPLERVPVDVGALCRVVAGTWEKQAADQQITLSVEADPDAFVTADENRLAEVLHNLLSNAMAYTPPGGRVWVKCNHRGSDVLVQVTNTGPGIAPEDLPYVFERFYRTDPSRARATGGSGLGLTISKRLVEAHGGRMWAESTPGDKTTFSFVIPAA